MLSLFETPEERIDRLIFAGKRRITEEGIACWCPIGKHWWTFPLPASIDEDWLDAYGDAHYGDQERCSEVLEVK